MRFFTLGNDVETVALLSKLFPGSVKSQSSFFTSHGMTRQEAERNNDCNVEISRSFSEHPDAGYTFLKGVYFN